MSRGRLSRQARRRVRLLRSTQPVQLPPQRRAVSQRIAVEERVAEGLGAADGEPGLDFGTGRGYHFLLLLHPMVLVKGLRGATSYFVLLKFYDALNRPLSLILATIPVQYVGYCKYMNIVNTINLRVVLAPRRRVF